MEHFHSSHSQVKILLPRATIKSYSHRNIHAKRFFLATANLNDPPAFCYEIKPLR